MEIFCFLKVPIFSDAASWFRQVTLLRRQLLVVVPVGPTVKSSALSVLFLLLGGGDCLFIFYILPGFLISTVLVGRFDSSVVTNHRFRRFIGNS